MVSASHNPADDNGLKVLDGAGLKLDDAVEDELEQLIWRSDDLGGATNAGLGRIVARDDLVGEYLHHRVTLASSVRATDTHLVLDARERLRLSRGAHGSCAATGAEVEVINAEPDGININVRSGATDPGSLAEAVVARGADVGFALDGDADRLIAVDAAGQIVDGDQILGILALDRLRRDALPGGVVVSVLSNGGLQAAVEAAGGHVVRTPVGDKYILEGMQVSGARLGGEKSGHVIDLEHTTSGDGIVTALEVLRVMTARGREPGGTRRADPDAAAAAAGREGPSQGPVGGRSDPAGGDRRRVREARHRLVGSSSGRRAPSPPCGSWSRGRTRCSWPNWPTRSRGSRESD